MDCNSTDFNKKPSKGEYNCAEPKRHFCSAIYVVLEYVLVFQIIMARQLHASRTDGVDKNVWYVATVYYFSTT